MIVTFTGSCARGGASCTPSTPMIARVGSSGSLVSFVRSSSLRLPSSTLRWIGEPGLRPVHLRLEVLQLRHGDVVDRRDHHAGAQARAVGGRRAARRRRTSRPCARRSPCARARAGRRRPATVRESANVRRSTRSRSVWLPPGGTTACGRQDGRAVLEARRATTRAGSPGARARRGSRCRSRRATASASRRRRSRRHRPGAGRPAAGRTRPTASRAATTPITITDSTPTSESADDARDARCRYGGHARRHGPHRCSPAVRVACIAPRWRSRAACDTCASTASRFAEHRYEHRVKGAAYAAEALGLDAGHGRQDARGAAGRGLRVRARPGRPRALAARARARRRLALGGARDASATPSA